MKYLQIKVRLLGVKNVNYRVFEISQELTFQDLHNCIIEAFGFDGYHLWNFHYGDRGSEVEISSLSEDIEPIFSKHIEAKQVILKDVCIEKNIKKLFYEYDYGDMWRFSITLGSIGELEGNRVKLLKSKGPLLLEDCGGVHHFYYLLENYKKGIFDEDLYDDWDDFECLIEDSLEDYKISDFIFKN